MSAAAYAGGMGSELLEALRAADPAMPRALASFDGLAATPDLRPDLFEHSVRLAAGPAPTRLTYYFDVHRRGAAIAREVGARFVALAGELRLVVPAALAEFALGRVPGDEAVLQAVLGVDASPAGVRAKYYVVFREDPAATVRALVGALGLTLVGGAAPEKVYILGCDVDAGGLADVKLYFRLERPRVGAILANGAEVADVLANGREVVLQQCTLRPERRQLYLHVGRAATLTDWMERAGFGGALAHASRLDARLGGPRVEPWIVGFPYARGRIVASAPTVYFHLGGGPAPGAPDRVLG